MLAALKTDKKIVLAHELLDTSSDGEFSHITHRVGRKSVNKLCKEAFLCLAESCTKAELETVRVRQPPRGGCKGPPIGRTPDGAPDG